MHTTIKRSYARAAFTTRYPVVLLHTLHAGEDAVDIGIHAIRAFEHSGGREQPVYIADAEKVYEVWVTP
jgi:hypothetical protein